MLNRLIITPLIIFTFLSIQTGRAQFPEDALRLSMPGLGVGARALGMGMAYTGIANDFSAIYWNPAGLGQIEFSEFSVGLSHLSYGNRATYLDTRKSFNNSSTTLNNLGLVYSFPTRKGSLVFALGYNRANDFTSGLSFDGFNDRSSIIQTWAPDRRSYPPDETIAEKLFLAHADTATGKYASLIRDSVQQSGKVIEGGGLNNWTASVAIEAGRDLFLGASVTIVSGSYSYARNYQERDIHNVYDRNDVYFYRERIPGTSRDTLKPFFFDFDALVVDEAIDVDISGFSARVGFLYRIGLFTRVGVSIKLPTWVTARETFSEEAESFFDNGEYFTYPTDSRTDSKNEYDVITPLVLSAGVSSRLGDLLFSGDIDFTDWTQVEFGRAGGALASFKRLRGLNLDIKELFRPTVSMRAGAEYEFTDIGFRIRGGFAYMPSPYRGDPSSFAQKYITGGLGLVVQQNVALDLAYAHGFWNTYHINYSGSPRTEESIRTHNILLTLSYRF